jgi:mannose/fructose/N-acetylgalactosamine-specific phosphotransferase system component IIB
MPIKITAKTPGFRRCGVAHTATPTTYQDGEFTEAEIETLMNEPNLVVEIIQGDPGVKTVNVEEVKKKVSATMTVKQLEEELTKMGVALPEKYTKTDLVELIVKHTEEPEENDGRIE